MKKLLTVVALLLMCLAVNTSVSAKYFTDQEVQRKLDVANKKQQEQRQVKTKKRTSSKVKKVKCSRNKRTYTEKSSQVVTSSLVSESYPKYQNAHTLVYIKKTTITFKKYIKDHWSYTQTVKVVTETKAILTVLPSQKQYVSIDKLVPKIPKKMRDIFNEIGCVAIVDPNISEGTGIIGKFDYATGRMIVEKINAPSNYHEFGHLVMNWYLCKDVKKMKAVYLKEKALYKPVTVGHQVKRYNSNYVVTNLYEFYAETFKEFYLDREFLKKTMPETYNIIEKAIKAFSIMSELDKKSYRLMVVSDR